MFLIAVRYGTGAVAAVYSAVSLVYLLLSFRNYYAVTIGLTMRAWADSFTLSGILSAVMGAAVYGLYLAFGQAHLQRLFELTVLVLSGIAIYALLNMVLKRKEITGLWRDVRGKQ